MIVSELQKVLAEIDPNLPVVFHDSEAGTRHDIDKVRVTEILELPINIDNPTLTTVAILEEN